MAICIILFKEICRTEVIKSCEEITGKKLNWSYNETNRIDHIWWISNLQKFEQHYPEWKLTYSVKDILQEIYENNVERWN